jgi:uncharacterized protein YlxW (UPF0749 family)
MRRARGRLALTLVAMLLGFLVVVQLRSQGTNTALAGLSAQDLTILIANLSTRNDQLRREIDTLESQRTTLMSVVDRGESSTGQVRSDLNRVRGWAGLAPVTGMGVRIAIAGPVPGEAVGELLNELRSAGAEALAVGGIRIVTGDVVTGPPGEAMIGGTVLGNPIEIVAVGNSETLVGSLTRIGGPIALLAARYPEVLVEVGAEQELLLPATERDLVPALGRPRL